MGIKNAKPLLAWAHRVGEAKAVDRILVQLLPDFLKEGMQPVSEEIRGLDVLPVSESLYEKIQKTAEAVVGSVYPEAGDV